MRRGVGRLHLYLVRPARAERRSDWAGPSGSRPLTEEGHAQARDLADWLGRFSIEALACGPSLHCRQTLEPLAEVLGKPILVDDRLDRGADVHEMVERVRELGETNAVVCLNRVLLEETLRTIVGAGKVDVETRCERGAAWMLDGDPPHAIYFAPHRASRDRGAPLKTLQVRQLPVRRGKSARKPRVAVLDMGSTSFHMLVAEWTPEGEPRRIARERVMLRMGSELARDSAVSPALLERSVEAVRNLCAFAVDQKAEQLVAIATEAFRQASNGPEILQELEEAIRGPIHLLSGEEEARVVYRAIGTRLDLGDRAHVGLDLGGGSLEIVVGKGREILFEKSLPLGVARMHGAIGPSEPHAKEDLRKLRQRVRKELTPIVEEIQGLEPASCVAVGGTVRALGRLILRSKGQRSKGPDNSELRGLRLDAVDLSRIGKELAGMTIEERLERPGVSSRRADLLPFGAEILVSVLSLLEMSSLTVCDWGLREGVLLDLIDSQST